MMELGTQLAALVTATAVAAGGVAGVTSGDGAGSTSPTALVIDADAATDGRDLVDPRLRDTDAEVRLPRTAAEARTNVLYLAELGKRVVVAGPHATDAADSTGVAAVTARDVEGALAAAGR